MLLVPDAHVSEVGEIDPERLRGAGIEAVVLDLDNTLLPRGQEDIPERVCAWIDSLKAAGLKVALLTNSGRFAVHKAADALGLPLEESAYKPFTAGYRRILARLGVEPEHAAMVGDQSYTDILGAHLAGMRAIMVDPLSADDPLHTRFLRLVDACALRGLERAQRRGKVTGKVTSRREASDMLREGDNCIARYFDFALIGNPVGHSLSPVMHNVLYRYLAKSDPAFSNWRYSAVECVDEEHAIKQIGYVRTGHYRGMNITMPYKRLALEQADFVDSSADAAGGANVLVRKGFDLYAYNTDGLGALGAIARASGRSPKGMRVAVCGTGPTSMAIAAAFANAKASEVIIFSRNHERARQAIERLRLSLVEGATYWLRSADYEDAPGLIPSMDVVVDATPRGMNPDDEAIIPVELLHEGQVVLDTVYAHGITKLIGGAREQGAFAMDGLEMLVEQAALSVEIWADALGLEVTVPREVMRDAATNSSSALQ